MRFRLSHRQTKLYHIDKTLDYKNVISLFSNFPRMKNIFVFLKQFEKYTESMA